MQVDKLLAHHGLTSNPFVAEEATHDPVFEQLQDQTMPHHPDFAKILGRIEHPAAAVVFGEKGSGKTAIRLLIGKRVGEHNQNNPDQRTLLVPYDELNPVLDRVMQRRRDAMPARQRNKIDTQQLLETLRLEDHQDAIMSLAVTQLIGAMLDEPTLGDELTLLPEDWRTRLAKLPRRKRVDFLILAMLYDQPRSGNTADRFTRLRRILKLGWSGPICWSRLGAIFCTSAAAVMGVMGWISKSQPWQYAAGVMATLAVVGWGLWLWRYREVRSLGRKIHRETPAVERTPEQLRQMLGHLRRSDLVNQPWPAQGAQDAKNSRYALTANFTELLETLDYTGMIVLIDRVDEPTAISGHADRMQTVLWPMLDNKFLQQKNIGIKLLLPIELRHLLHRESPEFYQEARLDKQHMVDRLIWSGATLFDLCTSRLRVCQQEGADALYLTDLFESDVSREMLVDALDQMHQPRDAFKFLYSVIQEHCRMVPEDEGKSLIARITLDTVRRDQAQRVQELYRGLSPA